MMLVLLLWMILVLQQLLHSPETVEVEAAADFLSIWVFQKFFTSLAVLPGSLPAISDHL